MNVIKEIELKNYPEDNTPIIRVFDDGTSYLLIDEWPMEDDNRFTDDEIDNFEQILSDLLEVEVTEEDRDRFIILTNNLNLIDKLQNYMENK
ncbi:MAG: hypothetical protein ABJD66_15580 [Cellulophaga sp.]|uniref:hypothetical protein n=1 Tax=Cellulophaga TaxID=104264 RepID=UPI00095078F5|nr:hypothetical protein [Cellulophaga lytica]APU09453.1 hypothetical protein A5M85_03890 [Cellulophaga lytica]MDO6855356.1 hypothetical protein [Cellulophaga lytica]